MGGKCPCAPLDEHEAKRDVAVQGLQEIDRAMAEVLGRRAVALQREHALCEQGRTLRQKHASALAKPGAKAQERMKQVPREVEKLFMMTGYELKTVRSELTSIEAELAEYAHARETLTKLKAHSRGSQVLKDIMDSLRRVNVDVDSLTDEKADKQLLAEDMKELSLVATAAPVAPDTDMEGLMMELLTGGAEVERPVLAPPADLLGPAAQRMVAQREALSRVDSELPERDPLDELALAAGL